MTRRGRGLPFEVPGTVVELIVTGPSSDSSAGAVTVGAAWRPGVPVQFATSGVVCAQVRMVLAEDRGEPPYRYSTKNL